jgi:hypothetical protein
VHEEIVGQIRVMVKQQQPFDLLVPRHLCSQCVRAGGSTVLRIVEVADAVFAGLQRPRLRTG